MGVRSHPKNLDAEVKAILARNPNLFIPIFLCTSLGYYQWDVSILSDAYFDKLCAWALPRWETLQHRHKHFIQVSHLTAGTGFDLPWGELPGVIEGATKHMIGRMG